MTASELELIAYANGETRTAEMLARIAALEEENETLTDEIEGLRDFKKEAENFKQYEEFFFDCFDRLASHYPCPSVTCEHDKGVIYKAIEKGEACRDGE